MVSYGQAVVDYCMEQLQLSAPQLVCHGLGFGTNTSFSMHSADHPFTGAALASAAAIANPGINVTVDQGFVSATEFVDGAQTWDGDNWHSTVHIRIDEIAVCLQAV